MIGWPIESGTDAMLAVNRDGEGVQRRLGYRDETYIARGSPFEDRAVDEASHIHLASRRQVDSMRVSPP